MVGTGEKRMGIGHDMKIEVQEARLKNDEKAGCLLTKKKPEFDIEKLFITERNAHKEKKKNNIFVRLEIIHQHHLSSKRTNVPYSS